MSAGSQDEQKATLHAAPATLREALAALEKSANQSIGPPARVSGRARASLVLGLASLLFSLLTAVPAFILGILSLRDIDRRDLRLTGRGLAVAGIVTSAIGTLLNFVLAIVVVFPVLWMVRESSRRIESSSKMRIINLAIIGYANQRDRYPAAGYSAGSAKPLFSWRTALLSDLDVKDVANAHHPSEPWDSPANQPLTSKAMPQYLNPNDADPESNKTNYLALVGEGTVIQPREGIGMGDIMDGASNTIVFVEANADRAVPWAKPADIDYDPDQPLAGVGGYRPGVFVTAFADGSVRTLPNTINPEVFRALVSRNGKEINVLEDANGN